MLHQVGAGTLGPVFRAHDPAEGRLVAIKVFHLDLDPGRAAELAARLDELGTKALDHPSIASPVAAGLEGTTPWLAQAYVPAESLDTALRQYGPAPVPDALAVVTHLAGALDYAAAAGVLHGALHPRDVLVAPDDTHLIDLGVVQALESCGLRAPVRRPYAAPEQIGGSPVTRAADIFALGAIAYELLTGTRVAGAGDAAVAAMPLVPGASRDALLETLAFALSAAPDERYASALSFVASLKRALGEAAVRTAAPQPRPATPASALPTSAPAAADAAAGTSAPREDATPAPQSAAAAEPSDDRRPSRAAGVAPIDLPPVAPQHAEPATPPLAAPVPDVMDGAVDSGDADDEIPLRTEPVEQEPDPLIAPPEPEFDRTGDSAWRPEPDARGPAASRALGPIAAALIAGLLLGLIGGYAWGTRRSGDVGAAATSTPAAAPAQDQPARESAAPPSAPVAISEPQPMLPSAPEGKVPAAGPAAAASARPSAPPPSDAATHGSRAGNAAKESGGGTSSRAAPVRGRLVIRSTPSRARVEIDGRTRGTTPLVIGGLDLGTFTVRVTRQGYEPAQRRISLTTGSPSETVQVPLKKTAAERPRDTAAARTDGAFTGSVLFDSRPVAARVYLDNKIIGVTPLQLADVRAGSHVVRLEKDGYRRWTASVQVVAGERTRVAASLEEEAGR